MINKPKLLSKNNLSIKLPSYWELLAKLRNVNTHNEKRTNKRKTSARIR